MVFTLRLRAERGVDAIRSLRALLKHMLRQGGLSCRPVHEDGPCRRS